MHLYSILSLATAAFAMPPKRDAQWGGGWGGGSWRPSGPGGPGGFSPGGPGGFPHGGPPGFPSGGPPSGPPGGSPTPNTGSVAYFLDNNPAGSSIVSLEIAQDGSIGYPVAKTSTGGVGSILIELATGEQAGADSLSGQGAVCISDNLIFTVNAGSNTAALLAIDPWDPTNPRLVGEPASTQGEFPTSITYSPELQKACVINGGAVAGVTCFNVDPWTGLTVDGPLRPITKSIVNETTPPTGPPGSVSQILFNPDSSAVFVSVKADSTKTPGSLLVWPVVDGDVSTNEPIVNQIDNIVIEIGFQFLNESTIFITDPTFGAALLDVQPDFTVTELVHTVIPNEVAPCWIEYDVELNTLYAIDAGINELFKLNAQTGAYEGYIPFNTPGPNDTTTGMFDSALNGQKLYSLAGSNGILVIDLVEEKQLQYLDLTNFGNRQNYQGFAIWP